MLQVKSPILNLFLLVLKISLDFSLDASYKGDRLSKILSEKNLEFVSSKKNGTIKFNLGLMHLPAEIDSILKKQGYKGDALGVCGIGHIKIVLVPLTKVVEFHMGAIMV